MILLDYTCQYILLHLYGLIISVESLVPQLPSKGCVLHQHRTICPPISAENSPPKFNSPTKLAVIDIM